MTTQDKIADTIRLRVCQRFDRSIRETLWDDIEANLYVDVRDQIKICIYNAVGNQIGVQVSDVLTAYDRAR